MACAAICRRFRQRMRYRMARVIISQLRSKSSKAGLWKPEPRSDGPFAGETRHLALRWVVRLRYGLIAGEIALLAGLSFGLGITLPLSVIAPAITVQILSNWVLGYKTERLGGNAEHLVGALF